MAKGRVVEIVANRFYVQIQDKIYACYSRGKLKQKESLPVVGDMVEIILPEKGEESAVMDALLPRDTYLKRPKLANISQMVLVVSLWDPKPDMLLLDKQLVFLEYLGIRPVICLNKIDLDKRNVVEQIEKVYSTIGYPVIQTNAKQEIRNIRIEKDTSWKNNWIFW